MQNNKHEDQDEILTGFALAKGLINKTYIRRNYKQTYILEGRIENLTSLYKKGSNTFLGDDSLVNIVEQATLHKRLKQDMKSSYWKRVCKNEERALRSEHLDNLDDLVTSYTTEQGKRFSLSYNAEEQIFDIDNKDALKNLFGQMKKYVVEQTEDSLRKKGVVYDSKKTHAIQKLTEKIFSTKKLYFKERISSKEEITKYVDRVALHMSSAANSYTTYQLSSMQNEISNKRYFGEESKEDSISKNNLLSEHIVTTIKEGYKQCLSLLLNMRYKGKVCDVSSMLNTYYAMQKLDQHKVDQYKLKQNKAGEPFAQQRKLLPGKPVLPKREEVYVLS